MGKKKLTRHKKEAVAFLGAALLFFSILAVFAIRAGAAESLLTRAEVALKARRTEEAKVLVAQYIGDKDSPSIFVEVGKMYSRLKLWPEALHYFEIATKKDENGPESWYQLGIAQHQSKKMEEAVVSFRKAMQLRPKEERFPLTLGSILEFNGDRYEARQVYMAASNRFAGEAIFWARLCYLNWSESYFNDARKQCARAVKLNPKDTISWTLYAQTLFDLQEKKPAMDEFKKLLGQYPGSALAHRARGLIYFEQQSFEQAAADLGAAFGLDPVDLESGLYLARATYELGFYELALVNYVEVCRIDRTQRFELLSKQRELLKKNKIDLAEKYQAEVDKL